MDIDLCAEQLSVLKNREGFSLVYRNPSDF